MAYPIFDETIVDLTWKELSQLANKNLPIILPVGIVEEHGPHMDLAPDIYLGHYLAKRIKSCLKAKDIDLLIAPPMYWGISESTNAFPGTFSVRPETMISLIYDIVHSLYTWGFRKVFIINAHGDPLHIHTIINSIKKIKLDHDLYIAYIFEEELNSFYNFSEKEDNVLLYKSELPDPSHTWTDYADIHAGGEETSSMLGHYPLSVRTEIMEKLEDSKIEWDQLPDWRGTKAREMTPHGYCGNPVNVNIEEANRIDENVIKMITLEMEKVVHQL